MNTFTLVVASLLVAGAHCGAVYTYGVPAAYSVLHQPVVYQTAVRAPVVAHHKELVHVPHHEYGYTVEQSKLCPAKVHRRPPRPTHRLALPADRLPPRPGRHWFP
ncbi:uncharacterized protein LOC125759352 isoform X2 [Rhipicephalus sanguineus]|uniref:uncharacterized protein LOC125759352 isoform X1 n=1 Tax=Rhipicephalus sanguineus TaxID=34632 RepID=UPI0020C26FF3|nr:uncharacterized protein LOC125759352 isoform X1 [Rhipicephalus sanguineus]XP_049273848.1 uncharacterized protein LOC125759352 isoform X2 [Rhipicephalus sanguineus]